MKIMLTDNYMKQRLARSVPGAYYENGGWFFDPEIYPASVRIAVKLFPAVVPLIPAELRTVTKSFRPNTEVVEKWVSAQSVEDLLPNTPKTITEVLRRYQTVDIAFSIARLKADGGCYLGWDRGLGKSLAALTMMYELDTKHVVIVTPNNSKLATWRPQVELWDHEHRFRGRVFNLVGDPSRRERVISLWRKQGGILLVHYEVLRLLSDVSKLNCDFIIVDESHRLANGSASRSAPKFYKALKKIKAKYRLCMSGSVILNSPEDLFGALHFLFPTHYRSKWRDWNDRFLMYADGPFGKVLVGVRPESLDDMRDELAQFLLIRTKDDELDDLPARLEETLYVELSASQRKVYDELAESFIAELPDGEFLTTGSVLSQLIKLRQVATGLDLLNEGFSDSSKLDLTEELVQDILPEKVVIFTWHRATAYALEERLQKICKCVVITGDTKMEDRAEYVRLFQEEDSPQVIIATIKTLGESVTLHAASDVIFVESSWTPSDIEQAADRVRRIGQRKRVTIYSIIAKDTVDETKILPTLESKEMLRRLVLGK